MGELSAVAAVPSQQRQRPGPKLVVQKRLGGPEGSSEVSGLVWPRKFPVFVNNTEIELPDVPTVLSVGEATLTVNETMGEAAAAPAAADSMVTTATTMMSEVLINMDEEKASNVVGASAAMRR